MSSNLKVNTILPSTGTTVTVSGISSVTSSISAGSSITATTFYGSGANLTGLPAGTTINNNGNDRIITGSASANTLEGESNLQFDGTNLFMSNELRHLGDPDTKMGFDTDTIKFETAGSERLRIDSTGNTHLGDWGSQSTIYGKARLNIRGADDIATSFNLANSYLHIGGAESTANGLYPISFGHTKADSTKASSYIGAKVINSASYESTALVFATRNVTTDSAPTERVRIDESGRLGIGANNMTSYDSIAQNVLLASSGNTGITIRSGGSSNYGAIHFADGVSNSNENRAGRILYEHSSDSFIFYNANTYALKIDSSQRLLIGTPTTDNRDGYNSAVQIGGTSGDTASMCIGRYSADISYPALILSKSRSATINSHTRLNTGDYLGGIQFQGDDGTRFLVGASIVAKAASPVADYDMATDLIFSTNYGTTSPTKSMTLDQQGRLTKPNTPFVMVHINTTSNRNTTGGYYIIPWDTIHGRSTSSNVGSHFNTSNHRFTAPVDGRYLFVMSLNIIADNIIKHRINGSDVSKGEYRDGNDNKWDHADASFIYDMNANDYYDCVSQLFGSGQRWNGGANSSDGWDTLSIYLLG